MSNEEFLERELGKEFIEQGLKYLDERRQRPNDLDLRNYYYQNIFPKVKELVLKRNPDIYPGRYDYLISTVGNSPEPIILTVLAMQPQRVFFLATMESEKELTLIIRETRLTPEQYRIRTVKSTSMESIYNQIRAVLDENQLTDSPDRIVIDITGGKKAMSAGAAVVATYFEIDVVYVDNYAYKPELRIPLPGSEYIAYLPNPMKLLGVKEFQDAKVAFNMGNYARAKEIFQQLARKMVSNVKCKYQVYHLVSHAYNCWDSFNFNLASSCLHEAAEQINSYSQLPEWEKEAISYCGLARLLPKLKEQISLLKPLERVNIGNRRIKDVFASPQKAWSIIASCYQNAFRRGEKQERYDMAALLLYRCLEMLSQLVLVSLGLDPERIDYKVLQIDTRKLLDDFNSKGRQLHGSERYRYFSCLPHKVEMLNGYQLLSTLGELDLGLDKLKELKRQGSYRNKSILAHGVKTITIDEYQSFHKSVDIVLEKCWEKVGLEEQATTFSAFKEKFAFLTIED